LAARTYSLLCDEALCVMQAPFTKDLEDVAQLAGGDDPEALPGLAERDEALQAHGGEPMGDLTNALELQ
jgi:hypothetical protein